MPLSEKRKHTRIEVHLFTSFQQSLEGGEWLPQIGYTLNISPGGAYFYMKSGLQKPKRGDLIILKIYTPVESVQEKGPPRLGVEGKIVRFERACKIIQESILDGIAVEFTQTPTVFFDKHENNKQEFAPTI